MTRRRLILLLAVVGTFVTLLILTWPTDSDEPRYNGRRLSKWLIAYRHAEDQDKAVEAISAIGTNAIPFLLRWLQEPPSPKRTKIRNALPNWVRNNQFVFHLLDPRLSEATMAAPMGFRVLGTNALPAIPDLVRISQTNNQTAGVMAVVTLAGMGQPGLVATLTIVTNGSLQHRSFAMDWMAKNQSLYSDPAPAIPVLVSCLSDTNSFIVQKAAETLGAFRLQPEIVVPRLADALTNSRPAARVAAIVALKEYGANAVPALDAISNCLNDRLSGVSNTAARAIEKIRAESSTAK
jgi:HEAT repeat protein